MASFHKSHNVAYEFAKTTLKGKPIETYQSCATFSVERSRRCFARHLSAKNSSFKFIFLSQ